MQQISIKQTDGHLFITLNNEAKRNALSGAMLREINGELMRAYRNDKNLRSVVFLHQGPVFCAGADLSEFKAAEGNPKAVRVLMEEFSYLLTSNLTSSIPTVAVLNGGAIGGGVGLALSCQYVLATPQAYLRLPEFAMGLFPYIISGSLLRRLGIKGFIDLVISKDGFSQPEMQERKLIDANYSEAELLPLLGRLAARPGSADPMPISEQEIASAVDYLASKGIKGVLPEMLSRALRINAEMNMPLANMAGSVELGSLLKSLSRAA